MEELTAADGRVVTPLDEAALLRAADQLVADGVEAIAVRFLFSFLNPTSELRARDIIESQHPGLTTSLSLGSLNRCSMSGNFLSPSSAKALSILQFIGGSHLPLLLSTLAIVAAAATARALHNHHTRYHRSTFS